MKISICIPAFNREKWIGAAIDSALAQTYPDKEVIVVDDGSSDQTQAICQQYGSRIIFASQPHLGGTAARNHLLRFAKGEWIQYLDSDDYLLPTKVMTQLASQKEDFPEAIYSPFLWEFWENDKLTGRRRSHYTDGHDFAKTWLRIEPLQIGTFLIKREALLTLGGWNEQIPVAEDNELWQRMLLKGWRFRYVDEPLTVFRQWSQDSWGKNLAEQALYCVAEQIADFRSTLTARGQWNDELQRIEEKTRFALARRLAKVAGVARGEAWYAEQMQLPHATERYASDSWKLRALFRFLGFTNAIRLAQGARVIRRSRVSRILTKKL